MVAEPNFNRFFEQMQAILELHPKANTTSGPNFLSYMDPSKGDEKIYWDPDDPAEVEAAETAFNELLSKGFVAFQMDETGKQGEPIKKFCPAARNVLLIAPLAGG
jgi:hypothetical protein